MNNFNAILTDRDGFKRGVIIDVDYNVVIDAAYKQANHQYTTLHYHMLDSIRDYVNLYYTNWKSVEFTIIGVGNYKCILLVNDDYKTVLVISESNTAITIHEYEQNGLTFIKSIVV